MPLIMGKLVLDSRVPFLLEHVDSLSQSLALDYVSVFKDGIGNVYVPSMVKTE